MKRDAKPIADEFGVPEVRRWQAKLWKQGGGFLALLRKHFADRQELLKKPARCRSA